MDRRLNTRSGELITKTSPKSPVAEAYRNIRTNLTFMNPDEPLEKLVITSTGTGEGKSLTTANLAISMAQNGQEVIILDADLRKPMQHRFFEMTNFEGLSNILTGEVTLEEAIRDTGIEGLRLISTGVVPPNPAELLGSKRMSKLIDEVQHKADIVLIDTPPVIAVTDASIIANRADGVIIVVAHNRTHKEMLVKARERLVKAQARVIGTILNRYPVQQESRYYNQYYYYTGSEDVKG